MVQNTFKLSSILKVKNAAAKTLTCEHRLKPTINISRAFMLFYP